MGQRTHIEWTNATWNPVTGCTKVSPGCDHCYAERLTERFGRGPFSRIGMHFERLKEPLRWRSPQMVFTCSMSDLFHPQVPWSFIIAVFSVMEATPRHTYQVLTKRPGRMAYFANHVLPSRGYQWPPNVWAGTSVEGQKYAPRLDVLARVPAAVRFVSAEPLLENIDLRPWLQSGVLHWVIVGGESGPRARPLHADWVRRIREDCAEAAVPFFFKQWGGRTSKAGGRLLDWRTHDEMPTAPEAFVHTLLLPRRRNAPRLLPGDLASLQPT